MKRIIALALICIMCFSFFSCANIIDWSLERHAIALSAEAKETSYQDFKDENFTAFLEKIQDFSVRLTDKIAHEYGKTENFAISPISIYMGLALACECSAGETRQEILDAVGVTYEEVSKYTSTLYAYANKEYLQYNLVAQKQVVAYQTLYNSIWLDNDVEFVEQGVQKLANEYNCDVFQTSFKSGEAKKLIKRYIYNKTNGLIDGDIDLSPETYFVLMNTYYLKEIWNELGTNLSFTSESINFQNTDGGIKSTKLLMGYYNEGKVYRGDRFEAFFTITEHGFKIYFIVPDDEWSISQVFTEENINTVLDIKDWGYVDDENKQLHHTRVFFPEFKAEFDNDISDLLSEDFGIKQLFDRNACDMSNVSVSPVYCEGVFHKTSLTVDKKGIEGAAVTYLPAAGAAAPPPYEKVYHDFYVDRAFGFIICDPYGTVVFSGVINTLN